MTDEESFVRHIRANPADEVARLVYADYLEERGDPRGEFLRVQCDLATLPVGDPRRLELAAREQQLLDEHAEAWLAPLRALGATGVSRRCFQRGLIERVKMEAEAFLRNGRELCAIAPGLHVVELREVGDVLESLARWDLPAQVRGLDLSCNRLVPGHMTMLGLAGWLPRIEELNLAFNLLGNQGTVHLVRGGWPRLRVLALENNGIGQVGAQALAMAHWPGLARLVLSLNPLTPLGVRHLARSSAFESLEELDLARTGCGAEGATALAQSNGLRSLKRLNLRGNGLSLATIRQLTESTHWSLQKLDVRSNVSGQETNDVKGLVAQFGAFLVA